MFVSVTCIMQTLAGFATWHGVIREKCLHPALGNQQNAGNEVLTEPFVFLSERKTTTRRPSPDQVWPFPLFWVLSSLLFPHFFRHLSLFTFSRSSLFLPPTLGPSWRPSQRPPSWPSRSPWRKRNKKKGTRKSSQSHCLFVLSFSLLFLFELHVILIHVRLLLLGGLQRLLLSSFATRHD